jgi:DNA-binding NarL/FixJ family response regulator
MIDAIAKSVRSALGAQVIVVNKVRDLTHSSLEIEDDSAAMIVYSDGAVGDQSQVDQDIRALRKAFPTTRIVLLTDRLLQLSLDTFHERIIEGIIPSSYNTDQLVACLSTIASGVSFLPPALLEQQRDHSSRTPAGKGRVNKKLTPRQHQIMQYIAVGKSNKFIAAELSLCESTVKVHVHEVMKRLGATSRTHASYILSNDCAD